jgi:maleate isomerase
MDRLTIGVLTPHVAPGPEVELPTASAGRVTVHLSRVPAPVAEQSRPWDSLRAQAAAAALDHAVGLIKLPVGMLAWASTTTSYLIGALAERDLRQRLNDRHQLPAVTGGLAAADALTWLGASDLLVVHPPWFDVDLDHLAVSYFAKHGLTARVVRATALPADPASVQTRDVIVDVAAVLDQRTCPVFLPGHGFRTTAAIETLENRTGRVVIGANQALLWAALRTLGTPPWPQLPGSLFHDGR